MSDLSRKLINDETYEVNISCFYELSVILILLSISINFIIVDYFYGNSKHYEIILVSSILIVDFIILTLLFILYLTSKRIVKNMNKKTLEKQMKYHQQTDTNPITILEP